MSQISIDYDILDEEGNNILDYCNNYDEFINNTSTLLKELNTYWKSPNSLKYQDMLKKMINDIKVDRDYLYEFGNLIIKVRREFSDDEDRCSMNTQNEFEYLEEDEL